MGREQKGGRKGVGERKEGNACPQTPTRVALLSHFSCSDNERPSLRSRRLVVVFRAKANLLALTIFKHRIPISGWFCYSTVNFF